jgi:hypothetical protein
MRLIHHRDCTRTALLAAAVVATFLQHVHRGGGGYPQRSECVVVVQAFQQPQPPSLAFFLAPRRNNRDRACGRCTQLLSTRKRVQQSPPPTSSSLPDNDESDDASMSIPINRRKQLGGTDGDPFDDDEALLRTVTEEQLLDLCRQLHLDLGDGVVSSSTPSATTSNPPAATAVRLSKSDLLRKLREHAHQQKLVEEKRRREREAFVERGSRDDASKERYETISDPHQVSVNRARNDGDLDDDDEEDFFVGLPWSGTAATGAGSAASTSGNGSTGMIDKSTPNRVDESAVTRGRRGRGPGYTTSAIVTAPPPPPSDGADENGERAVTMYSSADHNDLTGIAAAQPGYGSMPMGSSSSSSSQPWDNDASAAAGTGAASTRQVESAREMLSELVRCLLATTGAPAYSSGYDLDEEEENENDENEENDRHNGNHDNLSDQVRHFFRSNRNEGGAGAAADAFVGFQPGSVPTQLLVAASPSLRLQRGQVLREVLRHFELEAIGYDGKSGDDRESGGGHYREVSKVSAFLEGYRTSEVRRLARETSALLLDKLVQEGVEGLDVTLAAMARSSDDYRSDHAGELNDSLLEYLSDAIRQQEAKVLNDAKALKESQRAASSTNSKYDDNVDDNLSDLWSVEVEENGHRVESIDPNDPSVRDALQKEFLRGYTSPKSEDDHVRSKSPSEQLLFLLQLLKKRVEAEAAFGPDEKGRNLRLLAYCLKLGDDSEREQLILKEAGNSLDVSHLTPSTPSICAVLHFDLIRFCLFSVPAASSASTRSWSWWRAASSTAKARRTSSSPARPSR